ncbi:MULTISPECIES: LLM class flavin-dependent oxidoreductase [unclassified Paenibacillus]|uniref:LLM class flavin-dependent oxidoreductase n=1 Tax=unclassified Paenibacillus TaxID=185978 RepID=UPI001AE32D47|nr:MULTISPECIES: LLM class flavin-dependent oxidoreductase [unclassified Paenibacillus]MBP1155557.1 putative LLM family oxidoreductase [Paenibacillus sp. PvP091]MBP1169057.1 putative LLM family oxidoreductase [Paenibacillus sp. PvR098]MBP2440085.1 putative LLM family oxidoreductase [Paenibacillus sp. PvP052]
MSEEIKKEHGPDFEFGIYTFGDLFADPQTGQTISARQRLEEIVAAAKLADEAGLDVFGFGEHHRLDFAASSTPVVLAAIAQVTKRIRLTSATTVLSTSDPVQVFEDFATLDLISNGRSEIIAGRGAFVESFPLFGYKLDDYEELFKEKIGLLLELSEKERITWNGRFRPALHDAEIAPRPIQDPLPIWIGVGGTMESAVRAGRLGKGMAMALLSGDPSFYKPRVEIYKQAYMEAGHHPAGLKVSVNSHGYIAKTSRQALDEFYPYYLNYWGPLMRERGRNFRLSRTEFEPFVRPEEGLAVGSPEQIVEKILYQYEMFGHHRFVAQMDIGGQPFSRVATAIELLATEVAPAVRREISRRTAGARKDS